MVHSDNHSTISKKCRKKYRIGIVLSSGGGRGVYAHTGFMQAIEDFDIEVSAVSGCSAGALVGGIFASGTKMQDLSASLANLHASDYWNPDHWLKFIWKMLIKKGRGYTGMSDTQAATDFIRHNLSAQTFQACIIPFYSLAMNLSRAKKTLFSYGELAPRIMASAAIPVLYQPVNIEGEWYSDGAAIELAPTDAICCKHNLDLVIVHHTAAHHKGKKGLEHSLKQPWALLELLYLQLYSERPWYLSDKKILETHCQCGCGAKVVILQPDLPELSWPIEDKGIALQASSRLTATNFLRDTIIPMLDSGLDDEIM